MSVEAMFEFTSRAQHAAEGAARARSIGADMTAEAGCDDHEIIRDVTGYRHVTASTLWTSEDAAMAVLNPHQRDRESVQAMRLIGSGGGRVGRPVEHAASTRREQTDSRSKEQ